MAVAAAAGLGFASQPLMAATFTVNTFTDAGGTCPTTCTLRDAITKAELTDAADVIKFVTPTTAMGPQTITLTANLPLIERPLTITGVPGPKRRLITVDGADTFRMFRIDTLVPGMDVKISDLTMANGFAGANRGGCIYARHPDLILSNVSITSCGTNVNGGGIALRGFATLNMTDSLLSDNGAGGNGGGLYAQTFTAATPITIRNSSISHNGAGSNGGGLFLDVGSPVLIENTSLYYNNTGIMSHQQGGGIYILDTGGNGKITIRNSTLTENSAEHGGGIAGNVTGGRLEVDNSTLARNNAYYDGAGIHSNDTSGLLRIRNSTIAENNQYFGGSGTGGGGLYINDTDGVLLLNSIVQDNLSAASANPDLMGTAFVTENSIIGNTTGATIIGLAIDPATFLGGFADHGGPTATFATYTGTPIDNGDAAACSAINGNRDQRGVLRNVDARGDGSKACDIGAYEFNGRVVVCPDTGATPACTDVDFAKGSLNITDNPGTSSDSLSLAMTGSTTATNTLFGNPGFLLGTGNAVCIYANGDLVASLSLPAGSPNDKGVNSWKLLTGGKTSFSLSTANADGVKTMTQTPASPVMTATNAAVKVATGGTKFTAPQAFSNTKFLDDATDVVAQNILTGGTCVQVSFTGTQITSNVLGKFTAVK